MSARQFSHSRHLKDQNQHLHFEEVNLQAIADTYGTPTYVYSRAALTDAYQAFAETLAAHPAGKDSLVCFAVKANSNLGVLSLFAQLGSGFDIVSGGELARVLAAGGDPQKIVFSGVGKTEEEMIAALNAGILCFNVESASELDRLAAVAARLGKRAPISLRVNPDVDAKTHPYISTGLKENKFGVPIADALALYRYAASLPSIEVSGIDCHIGSQLLDPSPFVEALERILPLVDTLTAEGIHLHHIDLGGGLGIYYHEGQTEPVVADYLRPLLDRLTGRGLRVLLEPGRRLVGNAGVLITKVEYLKHGDDKHFAIVDAAMNDLARPALYEAWHDIVAVAPHAGETRIYDIVGPVCETGDFLGQARSLTLDQGDLLAVLSAGAYGMVMSSNYNTRPRAAEVLVDGTKTYIVRPRETVESLYASEKTIRF
ncbi:MAG: diaminopimelate decarboxylase [Pseudomonadota bacterium]|jgi:diaminopimelate decarboxylase